MNRDTQFRALIGLGVCVLIGGCTVGPKYQRATAPVPAKWDVSEPWRESAPKDGVAKGDRKSTRLNSSHANISYAVFCFKKQKIGTEEHVIGHGSADFPTKHRSFRSIAHLPTDCRPT